MINLTEFYYSNKIYGTRNLDIYYAIMHRVSGNELNLDEAFMSVFSTKINVKYSLIKCKW